MRLTTKKGNIKSAPDWAAYSPTKEIKVDKYELWRKVASDLSPQAQMRVEWMIFYETVGGKDASAASKYFSISRKTLHKWLKIFDTARQDVKALEDRSRSPINKRTWMVTPLEEQRITNLRKSHMKYGKVKLKRLYEDRYGETISTWKIERVVRVNDLYPDKVEHLRKALRKHKREVKHKLLIKDFAKGKDLGYLWHFDTVEVWWYSRKRYIFTALEDLAKIAYARVYPSKVSANGEDFLYRLRYLTNNEIQTTHQDNGSEFEKRFAKACQSLNIQQVFSRPHTPKDNPALERFNWTIQDEWLSMSEVGLDDIQEANKDLTEWLVEYNFNRPHHSLDLKSPIMYAQENFKVSPMWSASTHGRLRSSFVVCFKRVHFPENKRF